jgi:hypothetical protein
VSRLADAAVNGRFGSIPDGPGWSAVGQKRYLRRRRYNKAVVRLVYARLSRQAESMADLSVNVPLDMQQPSVNVFILFTHRREIVQGFSGGFNIL